jgi:lysozyme family protein
MTRFQVCLPLILAHEGGYVDDPRDNGGATNLGVTQATLAAFRDHAVTKADVRALTSVSVAPIYEANFWKTCGADRMPDGLDYALFDFAVNSGPGRAKKYLQLSAGVAADGAIGPATMAAVFKVGARDMIKRLCARRLQFLKALPDYVHFGGGWWRRVNEVQAKALEMAK